MATDKNITMKQYNGVDYDTLYPKTILSQIDGMSDFYFNKNQTLTSATAAQFVNAAVSVPDDALSYLGQFAEHWWRKSVPASCETQEYRITLTPVNTTAIGVESVDVYKNISISQTDGKITLKDKIGAYLVYDYYESGAQKVYEHCLVPLVDNAPCYIQSDDDSDTIYYVPAGATASTNAPNMYNTDTFGILDNSTYDAAFSMYASIRGQVVTTTLVTIPAHDGYKEYVHSIDRNAYPDNGEVGGIIYKYLGIPLEQSPGISLRAKIETGSYTGSGTTTKTLTFSFKPMAVFIGTATSNRYSIPMVYGQVEGLGWNTGNGRNILNLTWSDNSLTIKGTYAVNTSGDNYTYVAIG